MDLISASAFSSNKKKKYQSSWKWQQKRLKKMHRAWYYFAISTFFCAKISNSEFNAALNHFEYSKSLSIMKRFEIRNCIFAWDYHQRNTLENAKYFSKESIMTSAMSYEGLIKYFQIGSFPNVNTMIIMKEFNLLNIIKIFSSFDKDKITYRAHRFTWLVFIKLYNSMDGGKLNIPYNCRFLIASLVKENEYHIKEIYKVKKKLFTLEYDTFDEYELAVPNNFLYSKRMNLNGSKLVMASPHVGVIATFLVCFFISMKFILYRILTLIKIFPACKNV